MPTHRRADDRAGVLPLVVSSGDTAPFGFALQPDASALGRVRNRALNWVAQHALFRDVQRHWNATRAIAALGPTGYWLDAAPAKAALCCSRRSRASNIRARICLRTCAFSACCRPKRRAIGARRRSGPSSTDRAGDSRHAGHAHDGMRRPRSTPAGRSGQRRRAGRGRHRRSQGGEPRPARRAAQRAHRELSRTPRCSRRRR